jgi:flavin reductase (DIM6/NTAB) family NADH-FMN oxidoreductase RutF
MPTAAEHVFQSMVADVEYPMFVVTTAEGDDPAGCLVGFTTQCSIEPLRFLVCLSKRNRTWEVAARASMLAVHLVRPDQAELAEHFGSRSSKDDPTKMSSWPLLEGPGGVPIVEGCDWFLGRVLQSVDLGDHTGFLLEPIDGRLARDGDGQLGFQEAADIDAGQPAGLPGGTPAGSS